MLVAAIAAMVVTLAIALGWRNPWAPAAGALLGVGVVIAAGVIGVHDIELALRDLWRPLLVILSIMVTSSCAAELGVFSLLARWIEPRTRGPVRHAFRFTFILSAITAALLSNDAAILLVTPVVIELLRSVYPKRNPKFVVPFAFAAFVAAGVAPLPTGNPMNMVVASRAGIHFNDYALHMIPVALAGWITAYIALAWCFRDALSDEAPALGQAPPAVVLGTPARIVLVTIAVALASYPVLAVFDIRPWVMAVPAALVCLVAARGVGIGRISRGVSWELLPFVLGVLLLATALSRVGVTAELSELYARSPARLPTVGTVAAIGSALVNNHPMALLHSVVLAGAPDRLVYAALVGGDLGPRLLPIGSLAGLLWLHALRTRGIDVPLTTFLRVGVIVTIPSLIVSLAVLWLVTL
ncbi:MAG TPA: ArsB/NhaD family transporter [Kofleriaceae bacterium]|nr:ArsB/NhaD family transporter [Kofleriaceae bacterium]